MLVLSRYVNEEIKIGDDITITICGVKGDRVRVGIQAPEGLKIHRKEIWEQIQREQPAPSVASARPSDVKRVAYEFPTIQTPYKQAIQDCAERVLLSLINDDNETRVRLLYHLGGLVIDIDARGWIEEGVLADCVDKEWNDVYGGLTIYGYIVAAEQVAPRIEDLIDAEVEKLQKQVAEGSETAKECLASFDAFKALPLKLVEEEGNEE